MAFSSAVGFGSVEDGWRVTSLPPHSHDLTIANYHGYRVTHMEKPFPYAVRVADSSNIHFRNVHADANSSIALCDAEGVCRQRTYRGRLNADGSLGQITPFVEQGGESLAQDAEEMCIWQRDRCSSTRRQASCWTASMCLSVRTLYMLSDHSLYAVRLTPARP